MVYVSSQLIKSVYGSDALSRLDDDDEEEETTCRVEIRTVQLIELDEIILGALNETSYTQAQKGNRAGIIRRMTLPIMIDYNAISTLLSGKIIRSSEIYHFDHELAYKVLMTNPVRQGYIHSSERTRLFVVNISDVDDDEALGNSVSLSSVSFNTLNAQPDPVVIEPREYDVKILERKWPETRLCPPPTANEDDENCVFMKLKDLASCGIFSGDWALVSANDPKKSRLCKIYGVDDILEEG